LPFRVDRSVLIPRSETEELVDYVLKDSPHASTVLDICTGSGCIAASLAHYLKEARVYAVDISGEALAVAAENAAWNKADVHFWQKDIFDPDFEKTVEHSFDVIVSNPPYVRQSEKQYMHRRVLNFEPSQALFVEDDKPLLFYHRILKIGQSLLKDRGKLYFEINEAFGKDVFHLFSEYGYSDVVLRKDIHGKDRLLGGKK
ncbi:MAG: peptide chain release factor N(5)-glutamine methyltransferase, partial [Bacteroidales bacterium]|nr:peptide chain release factor N(5)-glutamine methyltransferase [Bacteroidales bacterium]